MNEKKVSIIIVNFNGGDVFKECLNSLKNLNYANWELIVVDNGSNDNSENLAKKIKLPAKRVVIIKNKRNLGFSPANNQALKYVRGEYILLLNNDTKITPEFLTILVSRLESDVKIGAAQPKIYMRDTPGRLDNAGSFLTMTGFLVHWGYGEKDRKEFNEEKEIFTAKGACLLTRKGIIDKLGLFDSDFGSYFEESDFCWRVWNAGYKVMYLPASKIYHKVGFTSKKQDQVFVNYNSNKNRILAILKNLEFKNLLIIGLTHISLVVLLSLYYLVKFQFRKSWMGWKALLWNMVNIGNTLKKRSKTQSLRIISDDQAFKHIMTDTSISKMYSHFVKVEANFKNG